jgi:hypothetical protein
MLAACTSPTRQPTSLACVCSARCRNANVTPISSVGTARSAVGRKAYKISTWRSNVPPRPAPEWLSASRISHSCSPDSRPQ